MLLITVFLKRSLFIRFLLFHLSIEHWASLYISASGTNFIRFPYQNHLTSTFKVPNIGTVVTLIFQRSLNVKFYNSYKPDQTNVREIGLLEQNEKCTQKFYLLSVISQGTLLDVTLNAEIWMYYRRKGKVVSVLYLSTTP
jgi:hypothetical protein